jgi:hypothetical protein
VKFFAVRAAGQDCKTEKIFSAGRLLAGGGNDTKKSRNFLTVEWTFDFRIKNRLLGGKNTTPFPAVWSFVSSAASKQQGHCLLSLNLTDLVLQ